jgi:predicted alpha/beta hydrolase family esterase
MARVVIIHGNGGCTNQHNWTPWLKAELEKNNIMVIAPTMPDNVEAKASIWLPYMHDKLRCDENTIIVGHSSGAVAAMRYAEQYKVLGSVLVGACYTDLGYASERISGYYDAPWRWDIIKKNQQWIVLLASSDDPFIPIEEPQHIQSKLAADYYEYTKEGHFMNQTIPNLVSIILKKLANPKKP